MMACGHGRCTSTKILIASNVNTAQWTSQWVKKEPHNTLLVQSDQGLCVWGNFQKRDFRCHWNTHSKIFKPTSGHFGTLLQGFSTSNSKTLSEAAPYRRRNWFSLLPLPTLRPDNLGQGFWRFSAAEWLSSSLTDDQLFSRERKSWPQPSYQQELQKVSKLFSTLELPWTSLSSGMVSGGGRGGGDLMGEQGEFSLLLYWNSPSKTRTLKMTLRAMLVHS